MNLYLVIAYRWGSTNDHWYIVYCGDDEGKALALGENERDGRGGKYGVGVFETTERGEELNLIEYFACGKEPEPSTNWRIEMFERMGHVLYDYARYKHVSIPDPENPGTMKRIEVPSPDQLLVDAVEYQEQFAEKMQAAMDKARAESRARGLRRWCPVCDKAPVYQVEYSCSFWRVPRHPEHGEVVVYDLEGNWCVSCEQLYNDGDQISRNFFKIEQARRETQELE